jgi:hypothetical protein
MKHLPLLPVAFALACGTGPAGFRLQLASSASKTDGNGEAHLEMPAGETRMLAIVVVGTVSEPVTFAMKGAPAFATLDGSVVTFSPQRPDAGDYQIELVASAGRESATERLALSVTRYNTPPKTSFSMIPLGDLTGSRSACMYAPRCTLGPDPYLQTVVCDPDGDALTVDVEVVVRGTPFSGTPSFSASAPATYPPDPRTGNCARIYIHMPGLAPDQSYDFAIRARDPFGGVALTPGFPDGWYRDARTTFDQGPCTVKQCACRETMGECDVGMDCCSGVCLVGRGCQ